MDAKEIERQLIEYLTDLGGWYDCPKGSNGKRLGPLVAYTGRYLDVPSGENKQYVGDTYINCAVLEESAAKLKVVVESLAEAIGKRLNWRPTKVAFLGAPEGGKAIALLLNLLFPYSRYIYPEKKVTEIATTFSREKTELVWGRHEVRKEEQVFIVEDLLNNFSTTDEMVEMVSVAGGTVIGITALFNRSLTVDDVYKELPIIFIGRKKIPQFRQDDGAVKIDIEAGNAVKIITVMPTRSFLLRYGFIFVKIKL